MHVRFSTAAGLPIVEEEREQIVAFISGILINPDTGSIEGFFASIPGFLHAQELFLPAFDIQHWGSRVRIRDEDVLAPLDELIRLQTLAEEQRTMLGQKIVTEEGISLGTCRDVQFDTKTFRLEWLFPKKWFRWQRPIPASSIILVRPDAIVVRNNVTLPEVATGPSMLETLDPLGTTTASRSAQ